MTPTEIKCIKQLLLSVKCSTLLKCHCDNKVELKAWRKLQNENIVTIHDYDVVNFNGVFFVIKLDIAALSAARLLNMI